MTQQALLLSGMMAFVGGCVIAVPGVLDAGDGDEDTSGDPSDGPETSGGEAESTDSEGDTDEPEPEPEPGPTDGDGCAAALDILVVVDNSGSMGSFQRNITDAFPLLIDGLDQAGVDWRLAITTADNGSIWCQGTPEHGSFVFSSCTNRLGDFQFGIDIDVQDLACNDICGVDPALLEALPTTTDDDPMAKPRPWLQRDAGQLNLPPGVAAGDAVRCLLPQGINGCGFEQPLESMRNALARTTESNLPEAGFLRDDASLLVLLVTDEADCSIRPEFEDAALGEDSDKVFWSDPNSPFPTSAACWNAGVDCSGDPDGFDACWAANKNVFGQSGAGPADAVMFPVARYQNLLTMIEQSKHAQDPGLDVAVLGVVGVGLDGAFHYAEVGDTDPAYQDSFGIGPGCVTTNPIINEPAMAVPSVRIRAVAEQLTTDPFHSICAGGFEDLMLDVVDRFVGGC